MVLLDPFGLAGLADLAAAAADREAVVSWIAAVAAVVSRLLLLDRADLVLALVLDLVAQAHATEEVVAKVRIPDRSVAVVAAAAATHSFQPVKLLYSHEPRSSHSPEPDFATEQHFGFEPAG